MDTSSNQISENLQRSNLGVGSYRDRFNSPIFNSPTARKSYQSGMPYAGKMKSTLNNSRYSMSVRSSQSILGIKSDYSTVECFGFPLPVVVNEALTFKDGSLSASCSENGWAWVVQGRRLLIWQYKDMQQDSPSRILKSTHKKSIVLPQCRELTLPHSDIGHKASLVSVFQMEGQHMASCIAVSATGDVRYWSSITHDSTSVDITNILDGQEFDYLLYIPKQKGYLVITSTCNLVFVQVQFNNGRFILFHKPVKQCSSFLGGFGKKVATILIGLNNSLDKEHRFVSMSYEETTDEDCYVSVLTDSSLQRWRFSGNSEQFLYEDCEVIHKIHDEFKQKVWHVRLPAVNFDINMYLLDMHIINNKTYLLTAAVNINHTPQMYYGIVELIPYAHGMQMTDFMPLKLTKFFSLSTEQDCLSLRFIMSSTHIYLYSSKYVYPLPLGNVAPSTDFEAEKIEFQLHDDKILSAVICDNTPLFFSCAHGLLSVTPGDVDSKDVFSVSESIPDIYSSMQMDEPITESHSIENNLHMFELDPDDIYNNFKDEVGQLKAAFIYRLKRNNSMVEKIVNDILRSVAEREYGVDNQYGLDSIVIAIAEDLVEDLPFSDPRWEDASKSQDNMYSLGSSKSVQILSQLKDKKIALQHFVEFLHSTGLWEKLNATPTSDRTIMKCTCYVLSNLAEKIVAAIALRAIQNRKNKLIEEAICYTVSQWNEVQHNNLSEQDIFYVKLCKFHEIFEAFANIAKYRISNQKESSITVAHCINEINSIILDVIKQVYKFRENNASSFMLPADKIDSFEYLPWTAVSGSDGIRDALLYVIEISLRFAAPCASDLDLKQRLFLQILDLIDIVLDGRKSHLESVRDNDKYNVLQQQFESQRKDLISMLIDNNQYEFATKLAEKYLDFQCLVLICDLTDNQERFDVYIKKYEQFNFSQFAINWHLQQNRQGEVFHRFKSSHSALGQFMREHPSLGWIQLFYNRDFGRASKVLFQLAQNETDFLQRKKSMLSLAKLSALAVDDPNLSSQIEEISIELTIIGYQERLNEDLLKTFGYDVQQQKVIKVDEIINIIIAKENINGNEFDFRRALELLEFAEDPYMLRQKIWNATILRDNWIDYNANYAVAYIQNLLFFKLVDLCNLIDGDCNKFLPPIDDFLQSHELSTLSQNTSFQYLLKLAFEYISDTFKK